MHRKDENNDVWEKEKKKENWKWESKKLEEVQELKYLSFNLDLGKGIIKGILKK